MAATKSDAVHALTVAALALPGLIQRADAAAAYEPSIDFQYGHYQESANRFSVDIFQGMATLPVTNSLQLQGGWVVDTYSGATPVLTMPAEVAQVVTGASGIGGVDGSKNVLAGDRPIQVMTGASTHETRYGFEVGGTVKHDNLTLNLSGTRSEEPDYLSHGYHAVGTWEFNQKLSTVSIGFGQNFDRVEPTTRKLNKEKLDNRFELGFTQVLSKLSLFRISGNYRHTSGYLSNPYKKVFIQELGSDSGLESGGFENVYYENRPDVRDQWALAVGYIRYFSALDSALHLDYRYFTDSWDIDSHTFEAVYYQPFAKDWMLIPRLRYYTQNSAQFYQTFYAAPREDGNYSSDFRLAGFGTLSGGLKLSRKWKQAGKLTSSIKMEAGFEYSVHAAGLQLGGHTASDITDFDYVLFTGAIKVEF